MSDFSLDDILDKYGHKGGENKPIVDADDILSDILGDEKDELGRSRERLEKRLSATAELKLSEAEKQRRARSEQRQQELEEKRRQAEKRRAKFEEQQRQAEERKRAELAEKQRLAEEKKRAEAAARLEAEKAEAERRERERLEAEQRKEEELRRKAQLEELQRQAVERKRTADELKKKEEEERRRSEEEKKKREQAEAQRLEAEKKDIERTYEIQRVMEEQDRRARKRKQAEERRAREAEERRREAEEKKRLEAEEKLRQEVEAAQRAAEEAERRRLEAVEAERKRRADEESERRFATKSVVVQDVPIEIPSPADEDEKSSAPTTEELELEKALRLQKIEYDKQKLLIKESELEDPDDFLTSMNPYDFGKKTGYTEQIETISAEQLSGDTKGIDGQELKALAASGSPFVGLDEDVPTDRIIGGETRVMPETVRGTLKAAVDPDATFELSDDNMKEFVPKSDTKEVRPSEEKERLLRSINHTMELKRQADIADTNPMNKYSTGPFDKIVIPTRGVGFDSVGSKVLRSGEIPKTDPAIAEQKLKELASKRKRRLSNFVLEDISDEDLDLDGDEAEEIPAEEDPAGLWADLLATHKEMRWRFFLLLLITLGDIAANVLQQVFIYRKIGAFGNELGFLSSDGIIYMNMICEFLAVIICKSVLQSGIPKIFRGRSDCDSVCAVTVVFSMLTAALQLMDTNDMQQGRAFIYIPVALLGLLFNSIGKLSMISRARKNYRFMSSEGTKYYAEVIDNQSEAAAFTKGVVNELPYLVTMRKTELLTDFLKKSYCEDLADRMAHVLVPVSLVISVLTGVLVYLIPNGGTVNGVQVFNNNIYWASSAAMAVLCAMAPFSMMFMVNRPFKRASGPLLKNGCALMGYTSAEEFAETNSVLVDASTLFPKSSVEVTNIKPCRLENSMNNISLDMAIILAASLAIKCGSVTSGLFFDMIGGKREMLADIDACVYEDNLGVMGWYGNKRVIMGSREQMKQHSIKIPELSAIAKYSRNGSDSVYLAVGGELVVIFFIRLTANPAVRANIRELTDRGVSISLKTTDSLITIGKITDLFDIDPEQVKIIGASLHELYNSCTKYTTSGCGALSCSGSFISLAKGINASKKLIKDIAFSRTVLLLSVILGTLVLIFTAFTANTFAFRPEVISLWNLAWLMIMMFFQSFRRY